jgi:uncharacterized membrane protein YdjX (TVP38/TMEM64 family)
MYSKIGILRFIMREDPGPALISPEPAAADRSAWQHVTAFYRGMLRMGPAGVLTAIASVSPLIGGFVVLGLVQHIAPSIRAFGVLGAAGYVVAFWALGGFAVVPTYAYSGLAGWTFGIWMGFTLAMIAFAGAAYVGYVFADWMGAARAMRVIDEHARWQAIRRALVGQGFWRTLWIVALVRLPPTSPFSFVNFVMAIARVPMAAYILGTLAGLAPRTLAVVIAFANLEQLDFNRPQQTWLRIAGVAATFVVVYVITRIGQNAIREITGGPVGA